MQRKARAGHVTGGRVFGYRNVEILGADGRRSHVEREIDEREAAIVRRIFELATTGHGKIAIAKSLNEEGAPTPRAQQGRPHAWAPSSVRSVLFNELYRGVVVWNRTRKRDAWGVKNQRTRPASDQLRIEAPALRIVPQELWEAAHARLDATRETYLRTQGGRLWGRLPSGLAAKYLLAGIARCGICGGSLEVRSRASGTKGKRLYYYSCSSFYRRGPTVCPNRYEIPMTSADAAVLGALLVDVLTPDRLAEVAARALAMAQTDQAALAAVQGEIERQLGEVNAALQRLTAAVAVGGDVPALAAAIKAQDAQRRTLERRLEALARPVVAFDAALEARLRAAVCEWREVLGRQVPQARQIMNKLLDSKVTFSPEPREGRSGFRFQATGTVAKLVDGIVPGSLRAVASPRGFEALYQLDVSGRIGDVRPRLEAP